MAPIRYWLVFVLLIGISCVDGQIWQNMWPTPTGASASSGVFGQQKFLVVGEDGSLLTSTNGMEWSLCFSPVQGYGITLMFVIRPTNSISPQKLSGPIIHQWILFVVNVSFW